jgi:hypothetical protein
MASTDALPVPRKNAAYRLTFGLFKSDGTLITGATGLDSEVSKDAGTFADATAEATEIATASGVYYLDLTNTEMNADTVCVLVKSSSTGAVPVVITLYPQEAGDIRTNTTYWNDAVVATPTAAGVPEVDITHLNGSTANLLNLNASASTIVRGTVSTGAFSATATEFESNDITTATADFYNGRLIIFTSGALANQACRISDYAKVASNGHFTVSSLTGAPSNADTFVVV